MNLETLKLFCDVVQCKSFSRGAARNRISQSAASQAIHQLETHLAVQLIDRSKRPFVLTPAGEACYVGYRQVLELVNNVEVEVRSLNREIAGLIRVAAIYSIGLHQMSQCMQDFMTRYPKAKVRLEFLRPNKVYDAVVNDEVDLGLVSYPRASRALTVISLRTEKMVAVSHPGHRFAGLARVRTAQLHDEGFVGFDADLVVRREIDKYLRQRRVNVRMVMEFDNIETIKQAVAIGMGISILPEPTVRTEVSSGTLVVLPLSIRELRRPLGIVHRRRKALTPTILRFVELLKTTQEEADGSD
jgi:DNA-binding transcriptional LysR family regulator